MNVITKAIDEDISYDVILCDFQKAFDKVPFKGMLVKTEAHGVRGELLRWIANWTENRRQRVVLNGAESTWEQVTSSVVQGSVLGPILFTMFINDLDIAIKQNDKKILVSKYADDTKLGREIITASDCVKLQSAVNHLVNWCSVWGMSLHPQKCVVLHFGRKNPMHTYHIGSQKLNAVSNVKDLGVHISNTCESSLHVEKIAKSAHAVLSQVRRATTIRDSHTFPTIYKSFIRPLLETAAPVWNPTKREDVNRIEKVQKRALRMISDLGSLSYEDRLKTLGIQSLEDRRRRGDAIEAFKTLNGFNNVDPREWFSFVQDRHEKNTRSFAENRLVPDRARLNLRKNFFTNRVTTIWNSLPVKVKTAKTLNNFKNQYDEVYLLPNTL